MEDFINFFSQVIAQNPGYPKWIYWVTLAGIVGLTQLIKIPWKLLVTNKINSENKKNKTDIVIMLIPIGLGILASYLYTFLGYDFSIEAGVSWGLISQAFYTFLKKIFARIKNGEDITKETINTDMQEAVDTAKTAEEEFDKLVEKFKNNNEDE
jgi:hypothetical protein